jgi:hypothetical protein
MICTIISNLDSIILCKDLFIILDFYWQFDIGSL